MSKVKSKYCGQQLDTEKDEWEKPVSNRYAHKGCCTEDNEEYMTDKVKMYARTKLGDSYNYAKVNSQLKRFKNVLYFNPKDIYNALVYWYEVQQASPEKANGGIGIVENVYQEAKEYYINRQYRINQAKEYDMKDYVEKTNKKIGIG